MWLLSASTAPASGTVNTTPEGIFRDALPAVAVLAATWILAVGVTTPTARSIKTCSVPLTSRA